MRDRKPDPIPGSIPSFPMTSDEFQGHQIFRQLLFPLNPHLHEQSLALQVTERVGKPKSIQHFGSSPFQRASPMLPFLPPHFQLIFQMYWGGKKILQICAALWEIKNALGVWEKVSRKRRSNKENPP